MFAEQDQVVGPGEEIAQRPQGPEGSENLVLPRIVQRHAFPVPAQALLEHVALVVQIDGDALAAHDA